MKDYIWTFVFTELPCHLDGLDFEFICNKSIIPNECQLICPPGYVYEDESKTIAQCNFEIDNIYTINREYLTRCISGKFGFFATFFLIK